MAPQGITIDCERCTGCGLCVESCLFDAIACAPERKAVVHADRCTLCGACVKICPVSAIAQSEKNVAADAAAQASKWRDVWVFAELENRHVHSVTFELLGEGRKLADALGERLGVVLLGSGVQSLADALVAGGADVVHVVDRSELAVVQDEPYAAVLAELIKRHRPSIVLGGATSAGRSILPRVAILAGTGLTADCTALAIDPATRLLRQTRPTFGGRLCATIECRTARPQMATVRPKVMKALPASATRNGDVRLEEIAAGLLASRVMQISFTPEKSATVDITSADVIVAGGRGMQRAANFRLLEELARVLGGGIGASRAAVDAGWMPYARQIGQTGRTVCPKLYIACGISGQVQHLAGMSEANIIVAINKDPEAPIFRTAHYGIVGDVQVIVPLLTTALKKAAMGAV